MAQVVADTSPIIAFHQIGLLGILERLLGTILVPPAVAIELTPSLAELPAFIRVQLLSKSVGGEAFGVALGPGESESIGLALEVGARLLIDEQKGRKVAARLGLSIVGTLGMLLLAKQQGFIANVRERSGR